MEKELKNELRRIIIGIAFYILIIVCSKIIENININNGWIISISLFFVLYIFVGYDVIYKCFKNLFNLRLLDENFLMTIASIGAFGLGIYNAINLGNIEGASEGVAVIIFYQVGEWFEDYALGKSRKSIASLMEIKPDYANLIKNNKITKVDPNEVNIGQIILVKPGEKIPLDGIIVNGASYLDLKALTGEAKPISIDLNDEVISGSINIESDIKIKVTKKFENSTVSKILELVENASSKKSKKENFITKFAKIYTPLVVISALLLFLFGTLITKDLPTWLYRSLSFLVVSCPCALVISIPLSFFSGIGAASKNGILIKGSNYIEELNNAKTFVFDKTGTLTKGSFNILDIQPNNKKEEILRYAAIAEANSTHPIGLSILKEYKGDIDNSYTLTNIPGKGIVAKNNQNQIIVGNDKLLDEYNISYQDMNDINTIIHVVVNKKYLGYIVIGDEIKEESYNVIKYLNKDSKTIMLTGDNNIVAENISKKLNLTSYKSNLLPNEKVDMLEEIIDKTNNSVCYIGDGINDAPVLTRADIGISMGQIGSDAAIEASDIVLMKDNLNDLIIAKKIAKKTMKIVNENIIFAIGIKVIILIANAIGLGSMALSIFGDVGVAMLAIINATRSLYIKREL